MTITFRTNAARDTKTAQVEGLSGVREWLKKNPGNKYAETEFQSFYLHGENLISIDDLGRETYHGKV